MSFDDLMNDLNKDCIEHAGGQAFTFTGTVSGLATLTITAIPDYAAEEELEPACNGSVNGRLFVDAADFPVLPSNGDEIESEDWVYKIVDTKQDSGQGLHFLLRRDREAD